VTQTVSQSAVYAKGLNDPVSYACSSTASCKASHARQVEEDDPEEKEYSGPPGWELGVGLKTPSHTQSDNYIMRLRLQNKTGTKDLSTICILFKVHPLCTSACGMARRLDVTAPWMS
jgi:hypothetical protein